MAQGGGEVRPIKFRAWDGKRMSNVFSLSDRHATFDDCKTYSRISDCVDKWVVMQFTGLLDKNGREIYEGDLLRYTDRIASGIRPAGTLGTGIFMVGYRLYSNLEPAFQCELVSKDCPESLPFPRWEGHFAASEVIGNIYENPELLEAGK